MTDFFESFSDEIEENAGGYAALGGLAALKGQQAQRKSLNNIKEQLAKIENKQEQQAEINRSLVKFEEYIDSNADNVNSKELRFKLASLLDFKKNYFVNTLKFRDANGNRCNPSELLSNIESIKYARLLEKKAQSYDLILRDYNSFYLIVIEALKNTCFDHRFLLKAFKSTYKSECILEYFTYKNDADFKLPDFIFDSFKKELEFTDERNKLAISDNDYYTFLHILCEKVYDIKNYKVPGIDDLKSFSNSQFIRPHIKAKKIELVDNDTKGVINNLREAKANGDFEQLISYSLNKEYEKNKISPWEKDEFLIDVRIADNIKGAAFDCSVFKEEFDKVIGTRKVSELRSAISSSKTLQRFDGLSALENFIVNAKSDIDKSRYNFEEIKRIQKRNIVAVAIAGALLIPLLAIFIIHTSSFKTIPYFSDKLDGFVASKAKTIYDSYKVTDDNIKLIESSYDEIFSHFNDENNTKQQQLRSLLAQEKAEFELRYNPIIEIYSRITAINKIREDNYDFTKNFYNKHLDLRRDINAYITDNRIPIDLVEIPDQIPDFQNLEYGFSNYPKFFSFEFIPSMLFAVDFEWGLDRKYKFLKQLKEPPSYKDKYSLVVYRFEEKDSDYFQYVTIENLGSGASVTKTVNTYRNTDKQSLQLASSNLFFDAHNTLLKVNSPEHVSDIEIFNKLGNSIKMRIARLYTETLQGVRERLHTIETVTELVDEIIKFRKVYDNLNGTEKVDAGAIIAPFNEKKNIIANYEAQLEELVKIDVVKLTFAELGKLISKEKSKFEAENKLKFDNIIPANNFQQFRMNLASTSNSLSN